MRGTVLGYDMKKAASVVKRENSRVAKIIGVNSRLDSLIIRF